MKKLQNGTVLFIGLIFITVLTACSVEKGASHKGEDISKAVEEQSFRFVAHRATAQGGFSKILSTPYYLKVTKDTLDVYLPYYGRAYQAPVDPTKGGVQFTSTHFDYAVAANKKGGWDIRFNPKDQKDIQGMNLTAFPAGSGTLRLNFLYRQPITFQGDIEVY